MWKVVGSVRLQMDAPEAYQAAVNAVETAPVVDLSANGVRFTCRPRLGGMQAGQYCVLFEASLSMESPPDVLHGLIGAPEAVTSRAPQSPHADLVLARLVIRQLRPGCSEMVLEIVSGLEPAAGNASCLMDPAIQRLTGPALGEFCEPLMRELMHALTADASVGLADPERWLSHRGIAATLAQAGTWPAGKAPSMGLPRRTAAPCPGRPPAWEDDWVYEQVDLLGRDSMEVYGEWLDLMPQERRRRLKDPYKSFRYALSSRRKKARMHQSAEPNGKLM